MARGIQSERHDHCDHFDHDVRHGDHCDLGVQYVLDELGVRELRGP